ncbi:MAG: DUF1491 family protein [Pseudomonadota bacterium]
MARLKTEIWVAAYLARLSQAGIFSHVAHKGNAEAGAVAVKLATMDGKASLFLRRYDEDFELRWQCEREAEPEREIDEHLAKQRSFDRDLWVIEVEDPKGRHLLDEDGLS